MSATIITPAVLQGGELSYNFFSKFVDTFRPKERIAIEYKGPNYECISFFWGQLEVESGEKKTIIIEGPPGFCNATLKYLETTSRYLSIMDRYLIE